MFSLSPTQKELLSQLLKPTLLLGGFALFGVTVLGLVNLLTHDNIIANERQALIQRLNDVLPAHYDNDILQHTRSLPAKSFNATKPVTAYLATQQQHPLAVVFETSTPQGYSGTISLVVGVYVSSKKISGVRVISHKETPGLGDKIDVNRHDWILSFNDKSLSNPSPEQWHVKKDGGHFDQFTGATITPRAVVTAVRSVLEWSNRNNNLEQLFTPLPKDTPS